MGNRTRPPLGLLVFVVGLSTLGAEIAAARLIAPFFGDSTIVWANTIGVVLVALSIGYWFGGRLADRHPHMEGLCLLVLASSVLLALVPFLSQPLLSLSVDAFDNVSIGGFAGSLFGVLALVAVPVLMLGAVSPWAIRLRLERVEDSGETAGRMYAISTVGSLVGTFSASLLLIPLVGTHRTFLTYAILLAVMAALGLGRRWALAPVAVALLLLVPVGVVKAAEEGGRVIHEAETTYQYARVVEYPDGRRQLELNEGQAIHSIWRADTVLTGNYWDGHLTLPFTLRDDPPRKVAMLGVAGGTVARAYAKYFPDTVIDAVEIDGELFDIGRRWFGLEDRPQLRVHADDARPFLRKTDERYDFIFLDTYRQPYIPFYLATKEFFQLAHDRLAPGRGGDHQRRPSRGLREARAGAHRHDGRRVRPRHARPVTDTNTLLMGSDAAAVARPAARRGAHDARRAAPGGARRREPARAAAHRRGGLHRRQGAGRVARRQVADRLRGGGVSELPPGCARRRSRVRTSRRPSRCGGRASATTTARRSRPRTTSSPSSSARASTPRERTVAVRDGGGDRRARAPARTAPRVRVRGCPRIAAAGSARGCWAGPRRPAARSGHAVTCQDVTEHEHAAHALLRAAGYAAALRVLDVRAAARRGAGAARASPAGYTLRSFVAGAGRPRRAPRDRRRVRRVGRAGARSRSRTGRPSGSAAPASRPSTRRRRARRRRRGRGAARRRGRPALGRAARGRARAPRARPRPRAARRSRFGRGRRAGCARAGLDTDARTGARGLYERVGMHIVRTETVYTLPL